MSVAFALEGKLEDSARWREQAADALKKLGGRTDFGKAAELLAAAKPPSIKEARRYLLPGPNKALILAALADRFPAKRGMYVAEAARFNVSRKPSYYLIERATEKNKPVQP